MICASTRAFCFVHRCRFARDHFRGAEGATHGLVVAAVEVAAELQDVIAGALP